GGAIEAAPASVAIDLLGVAAASGGNPGYAVLRLEAKRVVSVREGEEIEPGVRLVEVHAHDVTLERRGARETLAFPKTGKTP
ncbi:MAG: type II secretion system protein N, partial [Burkholderiales bacterium]